MQASPDIPTRASTDKGSHLAENGAPVRGSKGEDMARFVVVGASGFVGQHVWEHARSLGLEVVGTQAHSRKPELITFDILQDTLTDCVGRSFFTREGKVFVILCAAVSDMDRCLQDRKLSHRVNVERTIELINEAYTLNAKPVFISTGFVFDGTVGYYPENAPLSSVNEYGRFKAEVEVYLRDKAPDTFVVRLDKTVSDSPHPQNLFSEWHERLTQDLPIICIRGQLFSVTCIKDIARAIVLGCQRGLTGLFHVANSEYFYRDELARQFCYTAGKIPNVVCRPLDEFNFVDKRALKSYLDGSKFVEATSFRFTPMRQVMQEFMRNVGRDKHSREQEPQKADKGSGCR
jgi:dTDP-4-dehydrorhamnose reductase